MPVVDFDAIGAEHSIDLSDQRAIRRLDAEDLRHPMDVIRVDSSQIEHLIVRHQGVDVLAFGGEEILGLCWLVGLHFGAEFFVLRDETVLNADQRGDGQPGGFGANQRFQVDSRLSGEKDQRQTTPTRFLQISRVGTDVLGVFTDILERKVKGRRD